MSGMMLEMLVVGEQRPDPVDSKSLFWEDWWLVRSPGAWFNRLFNITLVILADGNWVVELLDDKLISADKFGCPLLEPEPPWILMIFDGVNRSFELLAEIDEATDIEEIGEIVAEKVEAEEEIDEDIMMFEFLLFELVTTRMFSLVPGRIAADVDWIEEEHNGRLVCSDMFSKADWKYYVIIWWY